MVATSNTATTPHVVRFTPASCLQQELRSSANATVTPNRRASAPGTLVRTGSRGRNPAPLASAPASEEEQQAQQPAPTEGLVPTDGMVSTG